MGYMDTNMFKVDYLSPKAIKRLFSKISFDKFSGCWNWMGNLNQTGYGRIRFLGEKVLVHRLMYSWIYNKELSKIIRKDIPILDHICNNKRCCNPTHLRLTSHKINMLRGNGPSAKGARQTHCKKGHLLPIEKNKFGRRHCQLCNTIWARERYRRVHNITPDKFKV